MTCVVRRLGADDLHSYRDIRLEALREAPEAFSADVEEVRTRPESSFRLALERMAVFGAFREGGVQIGLAALFQEESPKRRHRADLVQMYVRPEARSAGVGLTLIEAVLAHARTCVKQVHLGVGTQNAPALRLYHKAGFEIYGTEPRSMLVNGSYIDEHLMVRLVDWRPPHRPVAPRRAI